MITFIAYVGQNQNECFSDHLQLLNYIQNTFLPICSSSSGYQFDIYFYSDANSAENIIASILKMDEIKNCSMVQIQIYDAEQTQLPVYEVSNWLEKSTDGGENIVQNLKERFLEIRFNGDSCIQNARQMVDHLEKVYL